MKKTNQTFTFGIFSYNQELYIIEHLESIKFQILSYGKELDVDLVISDDASTDNTAFWAKKWLDSNSELFKNIDLIINDENKGLVSNYISCLKKIKTEHYKILAADDLYNYQNVFRVFDIADFVTTSHLNLNRTKISTGLHFRLSAISSKEKLIKKLKNIGGGISAPGSFIKLSLTNSIELEKFLLKFKWIEDLPTWWYLFILNPTTFSYKISRNFHVIYRNNMGISTNKKNFHRSEFEEELDKISVLFKTKRYFSGSIMKFISIKSYLRRLSFETDKIYSGQKYKKIMQKSQDYYNEIYKKSTSFMNEFI